MKSKNLLVIATLGIITLFASCAKEGPTGPTGLPGPTYIGNISGHVSLYDMYGSQVLMGLTSVQLSLNGNTTVVSPDATGYYIYGNIPTGNYYFTATDSGYASTRIDSFQFVSGTINKDIKLSAIPDSFVSGFKAYQNTGSANDSLVFTFSADTRTRNCIVFANSTPFVNSLPANYLWSKVLSISQTAPVVTITVPRQDLTNLGLVTGNKVYYAAYSYVVGDVSVYEDLATGKKVYNAVNTNPVIDSTQVP